MSTVFHGLMLDDQLMGTRYLPNLKKMLQDSLDPQRVALEDTEPHWKIRSGAPISCVITPFMDKHICVKI